MRLRFITISTIVLKSTMMSEIGRAGENTVTSYTYDINEQIYDLFIS